MIKLFAGEDGPSLKINLVTIISSDSYDFRKNKTGFFKFFEIILATSVRNITHDKRILQKTWDCSNALCFPIAGKITKEVQQLYEHLFTTILTQLRDYYGCWKMQKQIIFITCDDRL